MEFGRISMLRPAESAPPLQVCVIRKWIPGYRENETHYLFVDREGFGIQAMAKGKNRDIVGQKLFADSCYQIQSYACINPDNFTNTLTHPALIIFGKATKITPIPDVEEIQKHYFEIASRRWAELQATTEGVVDYIGILRDTKDRTTVKNQPYVVLSLRDSSNQDITIAVWEEVCKVTERFDRRVIEKAAPPVILALTGLKAKRMTSILQLQTTNATYVYLNPPIVETQTLKTMFDNMDLTNNAIIPPIENNISIADLIHMPKNDTTGKNFTISGSILGMSVEKGWYYTSCTECGQIVYPVGPKWFCPGCPGDGDRHDAKFMYRIPVTLSDKTGVMKGIMFDTAATQLLQLPCREMTAKANSMKLLQEITNKDAKFQIQVQKELKAGTTNCTVNNAKYMPQMQPPEETAINQATPKPDTPVKTALTSAVKQGNTKRSLFIDEDHPAKKIQEDPALDCC